MFVDVKKTFDSWAHLSTNDLDVELPGCMYVCKTDNVLYFHMTNSDTLISILTSLLGSYTCDKNCTYHYIDGTIAKFVKTHKWYEFKKYKKVFARICIE